MSGNVYKTGNKESPGRQSRRTSFTSSPRRFSDSSQQSSPEGSPKRSGSARRKTLPANSPMSLSPSFSRHNVSTNSKFLTSPSISRRRGSCDSLSPCHSPRLPAKSPTRFDRLSTSHNGTLLSTSPNRPSPLSSPGLKKKAMTTLHPGQTTWQNMSPSLRKKVLSELPDDLDGDVSLVDWYKKHGLGPEMLSDMPLVRKIYMSNMEKEINKEKNPKEVKETMPEVEEVDLPERYKGRRFSSFLSKEAQLVSLGLYEDELCDKTEDSNVDPAAIYPDNINSEELTERLQKAMHAMDVHKDKH